MSGERQNGVDKDTSTVSMRVVERDNAVVMAFDKEISWIAMEPVQAIKIAEQLRAAAVGVLRSQSGN